MYVCIFTCTKIQTLYRKFVQVYVWVPVYLCVCACVQHTSVVKHICAYRHAYIRIPPSIDMCIHM